jgi:hypothetical protein
MQEIYSKVSQRMIDQSFVNNNENMIPAKRR